MRLNLLFVMIVGLMGTDCTNIFEPMSSTKTDSALLYKAQRQMSDGLWAEAIATFELMTPTFLAQRDVIAERAAAYAGRCGLKFLTLLSGLGSLGNQTLFKYLFSQFPAATAAQQADCVQAETLLKQIGSASQRTGDENILMAFLSLAKIGVILNKVADLNQDAVLDAAFDPCDSVDPFDISAADAAQLATGLGLFQTSIVAVGGNLTPEVTADIDALCGAACQKTEVSEITNTEQILIRSLVRDNENIGMGTNGCVSVATTPALCAVCAGTYSTP